MSNGYSSHADYIAWVKEDAEKRHELIEQAIRKAFSNFLQRREIEVVVFSSMTPLDLAKAIRHHPVVLKPVLSACNIAARAIERDLSIKNLNTYNPVLTEDQSKIIAGYIKPFLPDYLAIPALSHADKIAFIDKEVRKGKGRWEREVLTALNRFGGIPFQKRKFSAGGEDFELDCANPSIGPVRFGIDVKRIEARRDIHKRCDEIVNKASKLKQASPKAKFGAVIYYPFIDEHVNIQNRLKSKFVDGVVFASQDPTSVENAVKMLIPIILGRNK